MADDVTLAFVCVCAMLSVYRTIQQGERSPSWYACIVESWVSISEPKAKFNQIGITAGGRDTLRDKTMRDGAKSMCHFL